jgi:tetratricopeptide (TPR) repeat protein
MAKFSSDADTGFLQTLEAGPSALPKDLPKVGAVFEKSLGIGLADKIKEAADKAKARQKGPGTTLQVDELGGSSGLRVADSRLGIAEDRLDTARKFIKESKFNEALKVLAAVLQERPGHPAATYFKGLCELRLDHAETALRTVAPLFSNTPLSLDSQVRQLRAEIREKMLPDVVTQVFAMSLIGAGDAALRRIEDLLKLDPAVPVYHFLHVHVLIDGGHLSPARAATEVAGPYCQGTDREILDSIRLDIDRRMLVAALEPARLAYRALSWRKARKELDKIRSEWGEWDLWLKFYGYLEALGGGMLSRGRRPAEVVPQGDSDTVDKLHFMLIHEELAAAKRLMGQAEPQQARQVLLAANDLTPHFPYLHYMLGQATYLVMVMAFATGRHPPLEAVESLLQEALQFAKSGARDHEIKAAPGLVEAIQTAQEAIGEVRAEQAKQERDVALIRPFGERFSSLMDSAKGGINSIEHFQQLHEGLRAIRTELPKVKRNLRTDQGRTAIDQFGEAVERNLWQLDKMEPEMRIAEQVVGFQKRLTDILSSGPRDGSLSHVETSLRELKTEVDAYKRTHKLQQDALKVLEDLDSAITRFRGQVAEAALVNPFMQRFEKAFTPLRNRTTPLQYYEAAEIKLSMTAIVADGKRLLPSLKHDDSRKSVQQVIDVAQDIVGKIPI